MTLKLNMRIFEFEPKYIKPCIQTHVTLKIRSYIIFESEILHGGWLGYIWWGNRELCIIYTPVEAKDWSIMHVLFRIQYSILESDINFNKKKNEVFNIYIRMKSFIIMCLSQQWVIPEHKYQQKGGSLSF